MQRRVTLKDIAQRAKVHTSTVSLALRSDPRLAAETRDRIQALAMSMGYVPDASLSALSAYRNSLRPHPVRSGLAFLTDRLYKSGFDAMIFGNASAQAEKMGYNLIPFDLSEPGASIGKFQSIWWNTGLKGVLMGSFKEPGTVIRANWERWPVVAFGYSVADSRLNRAVLDGFQNMRIHLKALRDRGYKRIGLCLTRDIIERTAKLPYAAYLLDQTEHSQKPIPVYDTADARPESLKKWILAHRVDVLIGYETHKKIIDKIGIRIPQDIGFSLFNLKSVRREDCEYYAGFNQKEEIVAASAIIFLVSLIHEHAYGLLSAPRSYMITGEFRDGPTVCKKT